MTTRCSSCQDLSQKTRKVERSQRASLLRMSMSAQANNSMRRKTILELQITILGINQHFQSNWAHKKVQLKAANDQSWEDCPKYDKVGHLVSSQHRWKRTRLLAGSMTTASRPWRCAEIKRIWRRPKLKVKSPVGGQKKNTKDFRKVSNFKSFQWDNPRDFWHISKSVRPERTY